MHQTVFSNRHHSFTLRKGEKKKKNKQNKWEEFIEEYNEYFIDLDAKWYDTLDKLKEWININKKRPANGSKNLNEKQLSKWIEHQQSNYKNKIGSMIYFEKRKLWIEFIEEYSELFDTSYIDKHKTKSILNTTTINQKTEPMSSHKNVQSQMSILHKQYKTMTSENLHNLFNDSPDKWKEYHKLAENNETSFIEQDEIPHKQIIRYLEKLNIKRKKYIADLGCGKARIAEYFKDNKLFKFYNYDHIAINKNVSSCDIKELPLEDNSINYVIMSLSMWGNNCKDYIKESHRILEDNGILLIIEPTKRWTDDNNENKLIKLISNNNLKIKKEHNINKFMFLECIKH